MRAADIKATAYSKDVILDALISASADVDNLVSLGDEQRPAFAPWTGVITFDWPTSNNWDSYRFWLNQYRLHALTSIESGGDDLSALALLWPSSGAPYSAIEINTTGSDTLDVGSGTGQRSLAIGGEWGTLGEFRSRALWALGASASAGDEVLTINAPIGIGSLIAVDSERMIITDRTWMASGQTASALTAQLNDQVISVSSGGAFFIGEEIMIDSERMVVRDTVGNLLTVQRAADGTTLAAHTAGAAIQWARRASVDRGALGTTAASHASGAAVQLYRAPSLAEQLTIAYAIDRRASETVGYARSLDHIADRRQLASRAVGGAVGATGIPALEARLISAYGRARHRAI